MRSSLDPVLAKSFMDYGEANWLQVFKKCEIILYRHYVDDIFCLFNSQSDADRFYGFLNKQHPNIKFTFKKQQNNQISFLDMLIKTIVKTFVPLFFVKKKTAIDLHTYHLSFTPLS